MTSFLLVALLLVQSPETIAEIRIHGNLIVTNDEVLTIAGVAVGQPFGSTTIADVTTRLRDSKKFDDIQILKRFASIDDPSKIALVIVVNEGPVRLKEEGGTLSIVRRRGVRNLMVLPILSGEDGYGFTYGARFAMMNVAGPQSRLSFPLTWGGTKQAGVELDQPIARGPFNRVQIGGGWQRQTNSAFQEDDTRQRMWGRVEKARGPVRAHGTADWQRVSFAGETDHLRTIGADVAFDTRVDPVLPRNAVLATASWEQIHFDARPAVNRVRLEGRGYIGLVGQTVLAVHAVRATADQPLPRYLKSLLGGWSSLRGFEAGAFTGDTLVAESIELRVPLSSPIRIAKVGFSVFADGGTAYQYGERVRDQTQHRSLGASLWMAATAFHMSFSVAHGQGGDTRVNFGGGLTF